MNYYPNFNSYRAAWAKAYHNDPPVPLNIDIELSSICTLRCPFCFLSDKNYINTPTFMNTVLAINIIDQAASIGVPALKFNWRGESAIHPDFNQIIQYARKQKSFHEILVNTNGNIMLNNIKGLNLCTKVMFSVDSMNKETYDKMRCGGRLDFVVDVITRLVAFGHPNIWVRRVITKENENEDFTKDVRKVWGDKVKVGHHYCFDRNKAQNWQVKNKKPIRRRYCGYPSQRLVVSATGHIMPCCVDYHEEMRLGHIDNRCLAAVWESYDLKKFRHELRNDEFKSNACQNCTSWMAYDAPERKFVRDR